MTRALATLVAGVAAAWAVGAGLVDDHAEGAKCATVAECRADLARARAAVRWQRKVRRAAMRARWRTARPTIVEAAQIASKVYGVDPWAMVRVSRCEISGAWRPDLRHAPIRNGSSGATGAWQFLPSTWRHTPWATWDPANVYVAALATAQIVSADGGWRQWSCGWAA